MRAVILVAGRGTRLRATTEMPKCLLAPGGTALIDRYVTQLDSLGVAATVVVGFRGDAVSRRLTELAPRHAPTVVTNSDYELGSILSLARGLDGFTGDLLLMDGDVLFDPELLRRLVRAPHGNALLVDVGTAFTGEEYMAGIDAGRVTELRRAAVPRHESSGEWVGFARLDAPAVAALRDAIAVRIAAGETGGGYEDALASILGACDLRCVGTEGLPWIEIDFPEDARRAEALLLTVRRDGEEQGQYGHELG
ncbi:MAG: NTP transferase domain-containing protein [Gemmatimonadales bacterium]